MENKINNASLVVDFSSIDEEAMKVRTKDNKFVESDKSIQLNEAEGEWIGIARFSSPAASLLHQTIDEMLANNEFQCHNIPNYICLHNTRNLKNKFNTKILLFGASYKPNVADSRNSIPLNSMPMQKKFAEPLAFSEVNSFWLSLYVPFPDPNTPVPRVKEISSPNVYEMSLNEFKILNSFPDLDF